ncbi:MAG: LPS-assembly protein LptD [Candidatus Liberibacter europaeus]|uniref:LPS-assembly protein LptD n=1 Tax=Candidatus Liberibacter europaeus TaxID=744859 RepID=A0A2T4VXR4_9HYPH|nr:LPS-assembly protein LptD [Candidatus Liberibacter europaeus]PTL86561.1 MAG: LPS-assembly protein LptD [Candidatus Liberibacter europaeus]
MVRYSHRLLAITAILLAFIGNLTKTKGEVSATGKIVSGKSTKETSNIKIYAKKIVHNSEANTTTATENVKINYNKYYMSADKITFNHNTNRIIASGNIKLIDSNKHIIYAQNLDITNNFKNGIIKEIKIDIPNKTYLSAKSATLTDGRNTTIDQGTYTACSSCYEKTKFPPFWLIKSKKIILNSNAHTIRIEKAHLDLFGIPVAYIPILELPDETVKRKTGFLTPNISYNTSDETFGIVIPYYVVISKSSDATFNFKAYPRIGIVNEIEFRKLFSNGIHKLLALYMYRTNQNDQNQYSQTTTPIHQAKISSIAKFQINPTWILGWHGTIKNHQDSYYTNYTTNYENNNEIYLIGTGKKNKIDIRALYVYNMENISPKQANVLPLIDYNYFSPQSFAGGELSVAANITAISRDEDSTKKQHSSKLWIPDGYNNRLTVDAEWKRNLIGPFGTLLTPIAAIRGDVHQLNIEKDINYSNNIMRATVTTGIDARYPIVAITKNSRHIFEGIAQLYLRTNELYEKSIPNEDSQSLVLDSTSIFARNKFSGFDRIEGGSRTNIGIRYHGHINNLLTINSLIGQSIHLYGKNSFAFQDYIRVEQNSGLKNDQSDYIGAISISTPSNFMFYAQTLIDREKFKLQRTDMKFTYKNDSFTSNINYIHIPEDLIKGYELIDSIKSNFTLNLNDNFSAKLSLTWNIHEKDQFPGHSIGLSYKNDCATFDITYGRLSTRLDNYIITARLSLRTIGNMSTS